MNTLKLSRFTAATKVVAKKIATYGTRGLVCAAVAGMMVGRAQAASYYWDSNGTTAGAGDTPTGTWGIDAFWNTTAAGDVTTPTAVTTANDDLFFSAGTDAVNPYIISLNSATQNGRLITFEDGTVTLGTGTLSLTNNGGITVSSSTVSGATISSSLTITGIQTFNVAAGRTLTLDTGTFTRHAGATLNVLSTGTINANMTGLAAGSLVNGIIKPWASFGSGASTRYATIDGSNNIIGLNGTAAATAANVTSTLGTFNYDVAAVGTLGAGANINTLRYTGAAGTIAGGLTTKGIMNVSGNALTLSGTVSGGGELVVNTANGDVSFTSILTSGTTSLVKDGSGRLTTHNAATTFTGPVAVNRGVLQYGDQIGWLTTGNITLNGGVIEQRWSATNTKTQGSGAGQIQILGGESGFSENGATGLTWDIGAITWGSATFNPSKFLLQTAASQNGSSVTMAAASTFNLGGTTRTILVNAGGVGNASATIAGAISNGGLIKEGAGLLNLTASNTYAGGTTISAGTLAFGSISAMPSSGAVVVNGGTTLGIDLGTAGDWTTGTSGVGTLGGLLAGLGGAGSSTVAYAGNVNLRLNVGADSTYSGVIANPTGSTSLSINKQGANALTLSNDNTFTGSVSVNAGTLNMSGANTFPSATIWGGSLSLSGDNAMTGAVSLNGGTLQLAHTNAIDTATALNVLTGTTLQLRSNTAATFATPLTRFGNAAGNMTINVDRVSSGSNNQLVLNGGLSSQQEHGNENTFNFTGGNGYTLSIPTLKIDRFGGGGGGGRTHLNPTTTSVAIGPVTSSSTQGLALRLRGTSTGNTLGAITHTGSALSLEKQEAGTWTLTGANNFVGAVAITVGSLRITKNTSLGTTAGGVTQSGASELAIDGSGGVVTVGAEALSINGGGISNAGALRNIAGNNTYGGTVTLAAQSRINSDSGTLLLNNATSVTGAGQNLVVGGAGDVTISGAITTTTGFVSKDSAGTLTLSGNNTYSGATTVSGGTLKLGANNVIPNASNVSISTATLDADTRTDTAGTLDVTGAAVINLGSGAAIAFGDSKLVDWTGGTLNITGTLGATSLRFGDSADDLTPAQLSKITFNGSELGSYILDANGYLVLLRGTVISFL